MNIIIIITPHVVKVGAHHLVKRSSSGRLWWTTFGDGPNMVSESAVFNTELCELSPSSGEEIMCLPNQTHQVWRRTQ